MKVSRVAATGALAATVLATLGFSAAAQAGPPSQAPAGAAAVAPGALPPGAHGGSALLDRSLRDLAKRQDLRVGTAVDMAALAADGTYQAHVAEQFSTVTPENVMKWESIEPQRAVFTWDAADTLVDFARAHGQLVRGHTLVWHNQNPTWLTQGTFTPAELREILRQHIFAEAGHFRGKIWAWDVANEVIDDSGQLRNSFWLQKLGPSYIADAFRWAHQADPKAKLFINDYNVEGVNAKSTAYYNLVRDLRRQGVPIQGFGIQGHLGVQYGFPGDVLANLQRFEKLGLQTALTEVDVRMPLPVDATKLQAQGFGYNSLLTSCLLVRACVSYTVWGFTDKYSWVPGVFNGEGAANLLDQNFAPKPAWNAIRQTLAAAGPIGHRG
jgi:endo-1,4-beta-xylanase